MSIEKVYIGDLYVGDLHITDPQFEQKLNNIKNIVAQDSFLELYQAIDDTLPQQLVKVIGPKLKNLIQTYYLGGPENLHILIEQIKNPINITNELRSFVDPIEILANHYSSLPREFFEILFKEQPGDMGPSELLFTIFTNLSKSDKGDLYDSENDRKIEVKGRNGRLSGKCKMETGLCALEKINKIFNSNIESRGIIKGVLVFDIYKLLKNRDLSSTEAEAFIDALSQFPESFTSYKERLVFKIWEGVKSPEELVNIFIAVQILSYADHGGFDDLLIFSDKNRKCQLLDVTDATIDEILNYGNLISFSPWYTGHETSIGLIRKTR